MLESLGLSKLAEVTYLTMLAEPHLNVEAMAKHLELSVADLRQAVAELIELALLTESAERPGLRTVWPEAGLTALIARAEADIARRQAQIEASRAAVAGISATYRYSNMHDPGILLDGIDAVRARIEELAVTSVEECVSLNPNTAQTPDAKQASGPLNRQMIERGVAIRSVYQQSFRNDPALSEHAKTFVALGADVRTAPTVPMLMIIYDRSIALLPVDPDCASFGAHEIRSPGIVAALYALFELIWMAATPSENLTKDSEIDGIQPSHRALLFMLASGSTDEMAARRLGVSLRTVKRMSAELMSKLDSRSRFQAGVKAARLGWC